MAAAAAVQQHRIPLKGYESSIDLFTSLLRNTKESTGSSSADVIMEAITLWQQEEEKCKEWRGSDTISERVSSGYSRQFHLQLLASTDLQYQIRLGLDSLRSDPHMKTVLVREGVGRNECLLEALILLLLRLLAKKMSSDSKGSSSNNNNNISDVLPVLMMLPKCSPQFDNNTKKEMSISSVRPALMNITQQSWIPVHQEALRKFVLDKEDNNMDMNSKYSYLNSTKYPPLSLKERKRRAEYLSQQYLTVETPDSRATPGYDRPMNAAERAREGADCDEVFPGVFLGSGVTLRNKEYIFGKLGVTHVLNAAEFRGVNVGREFFKDNAELVGYLGLRVEDTPQTQICRHFPEVVEFLECCQESNGRIFVNCVFGISRSTTCIIAFLMVSKGFTALDALKSVRMRRPVQLNAGFLMQVVDLEHKLEWGRKNGRNGKENMSL